MKVCQECDGAGEFDDDPSEQKYPCESCDGTGEVEHDPDDPYDVPGGLLPLTRSEYSGPRSAALQPAWL